MCMFELIFNRGRRNNTVTNYDIISSILLKVDGLSEIKFDIACGNSVKIRTKRTQYRGYRFFNGLDLVIKRRVRLNFVRSVILVYHA